MTKTATEYEAEWRDKVGASNENIYDLIDPLVVRVARPDNSVTLAELCKKYRIGKPKVHAILGKLISEGKIVKQRVGSHNYYVMVKR